MALNFLAAGLLTCSKKVWDRSHLPPTPAILPPTLGDGVTRRHKLIELTETDEEEKEATKEGITAHPIVQFKDYIGRLK